MNLFCKFFSKEFNKKFASKILKRIFSMEGTAAEENANNKDINAENNYEEFKGTESNTEEKNDGRNEEKFKNILTIERNPTKNKESKIFTIGSSTDSVSPLPSPAGTTSNLRDDDSIGSTDVVLRPHSRSERRRVLSTNVQPTVYLSPRRTHSTNDFQNGRPKSGMMGGSKSGMKKNDSMVLKLVIPVEKNVNNNYLTSTPYDDALGNGYLKDRRKHQTYSINSHQEYPVHLNGGHINHGYSPSEEYPVTPGVISIPPTPAPSTFKPDNPTPPEEKKEAFSGILVNAFSIFYALFNVTVGLAVYVADIVDGSHPTAEIFSLVLVLIACLYLLYLIVDISIFMNKKRSYEKLVEKHLPDNIDITETEDGHFEFNISLPEVVKIGKSIKHDYCFNKDRHSTNFYLKVGAAAFCFGHLIHSFLILYYQLVFLNNEEQKFYECASIPILALDFIYPVYSFLLLFFIFKYSNLIINKNRVLARFGIMHCLSSSLCFWVWTIMREVLEAIASKKYDDENNATTPLAPEVEEQMEPYALPVSMFTQKGAQLLTESLEITVRRFTATCDQDNDATITIIYSEISPYLYPFSVEYSILVVGVLYLVWQNINKCNAEDEHEATSQCRIPEAENPDNEEGNVVIHADCHASNKGLFAGFILMIFTIVNTILFFVTVYISDGSRAEVGLTVHTVSSLVILVATWVACFLGYHQITKLDINSAHHNLLDDILLFICIPAFFLNGIFSIIPAIKEYNVLGICKIVIEILQVLLQTAFLLDGLRRSSNTKKLRRLKPGRELVTFLIIANVAMWLMQTFEVKAHGLQDHRYDFYGKELWTILGHMCLPLMMFYRFHSSVCFCDIWKYAYQPSGH